MVRKSESVRPALSAVKHGDDLNALAAKAVWHQIRQPRNDQLARAAHAPGPAEARVITQQIDGRENRRGDPRCGLGTITGDVRPEVLQVPDRSSRPRDGHRRGGLRSPREPQDRNQVLTAS